MEEKIKEQIALYRRSLEEWTRQRAEAMAKAEDCLAKANACRGAIEALDSLLPAVPLEDILRTASDGG